MKHIRSISEMFDPMGDWKPSQLKNDDITKPKIKRDVRPDDIVVIAHALKDGDDLYYIMSLIEKFTVLIKRPNGLAIVANWCVDMNRFDVLEEMIKYGYYEDNKTNSIALLNWVKMSNKVTNKEETIKNIRKLFKNFAD